MAVQAIERNGQPILPEYENPLPSWPIGEFTEQHVLFPEIHELEFRANHLNRSGLLRDCSPMRSKFAVTERCYMRASLRRDTGETKGADFARVFGESWIRSVEGLFFSSLGYVSGVTDMPT